MVAPTIRLPRINTLQSLTYCTLAHTNKTASAKMYVATLQKDA
jgi:hypothetical protein